MNRSSKYAALAFLVSTVGVSALQAADGAWPSADAPDTGHERVAFPKNTRAADRKARLHARRLQELTHPS